MRFSLLFFAYILDIINKWLSHLNIGLLLAYIRRSVSADPLVEGVFIDSFVDQASSISFRSMVKPLIAFKRDAVASIRPR